jgi:tetratricopeptide (TPR) repeat protein
MVLAYNPGKSAKCAGGPGCSDKPKYGTLIVESNMDGVEVWLDGKSLGVINKSSPQRYPGITPGPHTVKGAHIGYEPDGPREEQVYPGQDTTVSIRILIARQHSKAAVEPFDRGVEFYDRGFEANYRQAVSYFLKALAIDPRYSQAALYLGRTYSALYEKDNAKLYLKRAIELDPDYVEAKLSYAAVLLDTGDLDEAIRETNSVIQRSPEIGMAWYLQSQAFVRKGSFQQGIESGSKAVKLTPANAEAHLWLAEALRKQNNCAASVSEYDNYLALSNFDGGLSGKVNYYLLGSLFGTGRKSRATQQDIWKELRAQADVGICDCQWMQKNFDVAAEFCQKALLYTPGDPFANYRLGIIYAEEYNRAGNTGLLIEARQHFQSVIAANSDTDEAQRSRKYLSNIDGLLAASGVSR